MATGDDVKKLAALARLSIPEEELPRFAKEVDSILAYISQIETLNVHKGDRELPRTRNVFREDGEAHEKGVYTKDLVEAFPQKTGDALKVKQIISHD